MRDSLVDLEGLKGGAEGFLAAVLRTITQPIWVVDPEGVIRFANPAALAALGYDEADELLGRHSHETIHHTHPDGKPFPAEKCPMLLPSVSGETVTRAVDWFFRRDGSMFPVSYVSAPIELANGRGVVVAFSDVGDSLRAERALRERDRLLAAQQESLLRVAELVARGAASDAVFATIASEVGRVIAMPMVAVWRYDSDDTVTVIGEWSERPHPFRVGTHWPLDGPTITARVRASGRPARIDDFSTLPGTVAGAAREIGIRSCAGAPILVDGQIWGAMSADTFEPGPLAAGVEERLAEFTALVATAISNSLTRETLLRLADEQAALRRVATLVGRQAPPAAVLHAVAAEVAELLGTDGVGMLQFGTDGMATQVAQSDTPWDPVPIGTRFRLDGESVVVSVYRTGRTARLDGWDGASGAIADQARGLGIRSSVATPIVVDGRLWGAMIAVTAQLEPLPADTESRLGEFTELVATAIANAQARTELAASRARLAAAADQERRRVVRDLHDGAQQRLVQTVMTLKLARQAHDHDRDDATELLALAVEQAEQATDELRELARGILPTTLTHGGLRAGVEMLSRRTPVPVDVDLPVDRFPPAVEATAYFVVAEALTNVAKHARAERARVSARVERSELRVEVTDDGAGGARRDGNGLVGLGDRIAALDGRLEVESPVGGGTRVTALIPLRK